jgi:N-acetylmuramoyl-L-alanine amidase
MILQRPSPNHGPRPAGVVISGIVIHADASGSTQATIDWLKRAESKVSYHYLVSRLGQVYQFVPESRRAWHCGRSEFMGVPDCNNYTVGVSFSNRCDGLEAYEPVALEAGAQLCAQIIRRHPAITLDRITTHAAIALPIGRKRDPGALFLFSAFVAQIASVLDA